MREIFDKNRIENGFFFGKFWLKLTTWKLYTRRMSVLFLRVSSFFFSSPRPRRLDAVDFWIPSRYCFSIVEVAKVEIEEYCSVLEIGGLERITRGIDPKISISGRKVGRERVCLVDRFRDAVPFSNNSQVVVRLDVRDRNLLKWNMKMYVSALNMYACDSQHDKQGLVNWPSFWFQGLWHATPHGRRRSSWSRPIHNSS